MFCQNLLIFLNISETESFITQYSIHFFIRLIPREVELPTTWQALREEGQARRPLSGFSAAPKDASRFAGFPLRKIQDCFPNDLTSQTHQAQ